MNLAECVPYEGETRQFNRIFGQEIAKSSPGLPEVGWSSGLVCPPICTQHIGEAIDLLH